MKLTRLFVTMLVAASAAIPGAQADWQPGPGWGPGRGPGWGPPPPPPPPPMFGLCRGNFAGTDQSGHHAYLSLNGIYGGGCRVTATINLQCPNQTVYAQGTCEENNGFARLSLFLTNGVSVTGQIYRASDGRVYLESTDNSGQSIVFQRQ